jgi:hypothetical protein
VELDCVQLLGDVGQLVGASPRPRFVGPGELRVPDGVDDLEQLRRITHLFAEQARPLIVFSHLSRQIPLRDVERDTVEHANLELCLVAVRSLGHASEKVQGFPGVDERLPVGEALLRVPDAQIQVLDGPGMVVASLEMDGEFRSDLGQAVATRTR